MTTHGMATDGTAVFTIWLDDIHQVDGRFFAWWDHAGEPGRHQEPAERTKSYARGFVRRAADNKGRNCRAVIVHPRKPKPDRKAASADYPDPRWATIIFRAADVDALQFIAELLPPAVGIDTREE
jgi:hypothetical protein